MPDSKITVQSVTEIAKNYGFNYWGCVHNWHGWVIYPDNEEDMRYKALNLILEPQLKYWDDQTDKLVVVSPVEATPETIHSLFQKRLDSDWSVSCL